MNNSFEYKLRLLRIWEFLDLKFSTSEEAVKQSEIIDHALNNKLGSRKSIINVLQKFVETNMIHELELPSKGPGRPKKAYKRWQSVDEPLLINLGELPPTLNEYITKRSEKLHLGKGKVMLQMVVWAFLQFYEEQQYNLRGPYPVPKHLSGPISPRDMSKT
ncbi:MAG: hypothetical protein HeimC3_39820 [Candidatus Heimdallarchaeota archaeon LC_3]|nr:MAG: hypothetical protein HeimC3_39820 [Candidatus Heimdallarchaeota archaeon LC_3]